MGYNYFLLGSLYLGDSVQPIPQQPWTGGDISQYIDGTSISIGEAEPGKKITWLKPNGMNLLVAAIRSGIGIGCSFSEAMCAGKVVMARIA